MLDSARASAAATEATSAELAAALEREAREKLELSAQREEISQELRRVNDQYKERAAAAEAAQAQALSELNGAYEARLSALRAELVDTEAGLAGLKTDAAQKGLVNRLLPAGIRHRRIAKQLIASGLFDVEFYRTQYPEALAGAPSAGANSALAAARHYVEQGFCKGCRPNPMFDSRWYLDRYDDVRRAGINPLLHYIFDGWREGRDPGPEFQTEYYLEANPDVRAANVNPLAHYLRHGRHEGRRPARPG